MLSLGMLVSEVQNWLPLLNNDAYVLECYLVRVRSGWL